LSLDLIERTEIIYARAADGQCGRDGPVRGGGWVMGAGAGERISPAKVVGGDRASENAPVAGILIFISRARAHTKYIHNVR